MKATPESAPASYDSVMSLYREVVEALVHDSDAVFDAETMFCAEVERLAAQSAPTEIHADTPRHELLPRLRRLTSSLYAGSRQSCAPKCWIATASPVRCAG